MKIATTILMIVSVAFCGLGWLLQEKRDDHDYFFGTALVLAGACLLWGLMMSLYRKRFYLALGCAVVGAVELFVLFVICARAMA